MKKIDVMFCFNRGAWMQASVCISSLLRTTQCGGCAYNIHIVCDNDVDTAIKNQLMDLFTDYPDSCIDFTVPAEKYFINANVEKKWHRIFYYRLFAAELFPNLNKIIYFDTDIIFTKNLIELDDVDISGYPIAGVVDYWYPRPNIEIYNRFDVYDLFDNCKYINSGMLIENLAEIRKLNLIQLWTDMISKNRFPIFDQDLINITCKNKIKYLPMKFNRGAYYTAEYCEKYRVILGDSIECLKDNLENYTVLHYIGFKPEGAKTLGEWHNDVWWAECARVPHIYDIMRRKQAIEIANMPIKTHHSFWWHLVRMKF